MRSASRGQEMYDDGGHCGQGRCVVLMHRVQARQTRLKLLSLPFPCKWWSRESFQIWICANFIFKVGSLCFGFYFLFSMGFPPLSSEMTGAVWMVSGGLSSTPADHAPVHQAVTIILFPWQVQAVAAQQRDRAGTAHRLPSFAGYV